MSRGKGNTEKRKEEKQMEKQKEIKRYLQHDKHLNTMDLILWQEKDYFENIEGKTQQEQYLMDCLEKEINDLRYTIECLKNEMETNRFKIENEYFKEIDNITR